MRSLKVINKITACIVRCAPLASIVSVMNVLIDAFTPVFITVITAGIVDETANYSVEAGSRDKILFYGILFCGVFVLKDIFNLISGIAENIGVYDKSLFFFKRQIIEKLHKLPLVSFEMPDVLDKKNEPNEHSMTNCYRKFFRDCCALLPRL